jgi:hypothetical protein
MARLAEMSLSEHYFQEILLGYDPDCIRLTLFSPYPYILSRIHTIFRGDYLLSRMEAAGIAINSEPLNIEYRRGVVLTLTVTEIKKGVIRPFAYQMHQGIKTLLTDLWASTSPYEYGDQWLLRVPIWSQLQRCQILVESRIIP